MDFGFTAPLSPHQDRFDHRAVMHALQSCRKVLCWKAFDQLVYREVALAVPLQHFRYEFSRDRIALEMCLDYDSLPHENHDRNSDFCRRICRRANLEVPTTMAKTVHS